MTSQRSRRGCEECRRRRRKCDEVRPTCASCAASSRTCQYKLQVVWATGQDLEIKSNHRARKIPVNRASTDGNIPMRSPCFRVRLTCEDQDVTSASHITLPHSYPYHGTPMPRKYQRLLHYFTDVILASLSCHPTIHQDLCRGLLPNTAESPQLLSACLALSAAGCMSRGLSQIEGVELSRILHHLQSSGLSLLRSALQKGETDEVMLVACLLWCLADVFSYQHSCSSWHVHLQGMRAMLSDTRFHSRLGKGSRLTPLAMRHFHRLYLSLQALPYMTGRERKTPLDDVDLSWPAAPPIMPESHPSIDGFLGYNADLLDILSHIDTISQRLDCTDLSEADELLGKLTAMIDRDTTTPLTVAICSSLSPEYGFEFSLCHQTFQQATLVHLHRRLYHLPSNAQPIQNAVNMIRTQISNMTQGQPCRAWVAMAMPLFTIGCEAFCQDQRAFVLDKLQKLEECLGSLHVKMIRRALEDVWAFRAEMNDTCGRLCANVLLAKLQYNIILF